MKPWRLTPHAEESLVDILTWTIENFGDRQALAYHDGLLRESISWQAVWHHTQKVAPY